MERLLVLVSGWSDNGWLSGGHAVRMAVELCESSYTFRACAFRSTGTGQCTLERVP